MVTLIGTSRGIYCTDTQTQATCSSASQPVCPEAKGVRDLQLIQGVYFAGTRHGLFRSTDATDWEPSGLADYEVWQIRASEHDGTTRLYASCQPASLFSSDDLGQTWQEIQSFRQHPEAQSWCVPIDPPLPGQARALVTGPNTLWVGVEVGGIMISRDGGESWSLVLPGENPDIHMLFAHPTDPDTLFVSTGYGRLDGIAEMVEGNAGVFRSTDAGQTWEYIWSGVTPRYSRPMCIDNRAPFALTVAAAPTAFSHYKQEPGAQACLFQSLDEGKSWKNLGDRDHNPSAANFHGLCVDANVAGGVVTGTDSGEVWRVSPDNSWQQIASGLPAVTALLSV